MVEKMGMNLPLTLVILAMLLSAILVIFLITRIKRLLSVAVQFKKITDEFLPPGTIRSIDIKGLGAVRKVTLYVNLENKNLLTEDILNKIKTAVYRSKLGFLPDFSVEEYEPE
jgi:hypothetical protein